MEVTEGKVSEEQGGFRKGRGCVDQIFAMKRLVEEYLEKDKKLYAAFIDLEKAYNRVNREVLWSVLRIYDVGGQLFKRIQVFYREANACVRVGGEFSESFVVEVGVKQGCMMSPWLFNIFMEGCMREIKCKVGNTGAKLRLNGEGWSVVTCLFADDIVLLVESEGDLLREVNVFYSVRKRRKLKVNAGKSKVMVFKRREEGVVDFNTAYRIRLPTVATCRIMLGSEKMEEVSEFKYLETVLCKHGGMEGEIRERVMKGKSVVGSLAGVMKGRNVSMDVKRGLRNSILLPTLTYGSENWTWNGAQQSGVRAVEMSYLRGACGVSRWDGQSKTNAYEKCGMRKRGSGVGCGVAEWVKRSTLRWFGHIERMGNEEFLKVYLSSAEDTNRRRRPLGRWEDRVKKYVSERGVRGNGLEWARREGMDRERWRSVCRDHPLGGASGGSKASELLID